MGRNTRGPRGGELGIVLVATFFILLAVLSMMVALGTFSEEGLKLSLARMHAVNGYYAAEAGLNRKYLQLKKSFNDFIIPHGSSPNGDPPCGPFGNLADGSGQFGCLVTELGRYRSATYVVEPPGNPQPVRVPSGERFEGLFAFQYRYFVRSIARQVDTGYEVGRLDMELRNRSIPLFQFAAFSANDLEIFNGPHMTINGPVHTNGSLYVDSNTMVDLQGTVSASGLIYRGLKYQGGSTLGGEAAGRSTYGPVIPFPKPASRSPLTNIDIEKFKGNVRHNIPPPELPTAQIIETGPGNLAWDKADLRLVVDVDNINAPLDPMRPVKVVNTNGSIDHYRTEFLHKCVGKRLARFLPFAYKKSDAFHPCGHGRTAFEKCNSVTTPDWTPIIPSATCTATPANLDLSCGAPPASGPPPSSGPPPPSGGGPSGGAFNRHAMPDTMLASLGQFSSQVSRLSGVSFDLFQPPAIVTDGGRNDTVGSGGGAVVPITEGIVCEIPPGCVITSNINNTVRDCYQGKYLVIDGIEFPHPCQFEGFSHVLADVSASEHAEWPHGVVRYQADGLGQVNWMEKVTFRNSLPSSNFESSWSYSLKPGDGPTDRKGNLYSVLEIDMEGLLTCIAEGIANGVNILENGVGLDDGVKNGLVLYATVRGPRSQASQSNYGVLIGNGKRLQPSVGSARLRGLTVASDQRVFILGDYNSPADAADEIPAAIFSDSIQVFSEHACDQIYKNPRRNCSDPVGAGIGGRWLNFPKFVEHFGGVKYGWITTNPQLVAHPTKVHAAFLSGVHVSGGVNGPGGHDKTHDPYGHTIPHRGPGLMNFMAFVENWKDVEFRYKGSLVSLWTPQHDSSPFIHPGEPWLRFGQNHGGVYEAPVRAWSHDPRFYTVEGLPPLTPLLNYVEQEVFERPVG